jgi:soluble lytic murein transglycosylase-like protein
MMHPTLGKLTLATALTMGVATVAQAGAQIYEPMSASARAHLSKALADVAVTEVSVLRTAQTQSWLAEMSRRLAKRLPDEQFRIEFLQTLYYEATRAGLDPELMLGLIQVESGFKKYAVSPVGARGYTQVMPFWLKVIGTSEHNLFHLRTNLRYGALILRHYIDIEKGDLYRALGRYNGSLGRPEYPTLVVNAWQKNWRYTAPARVTTLRPISGSG